MEFLYVQGGLIMTLVYILSQKLKKYVSKRFMPLVPLTLAPLFGGLLAYALGQDVSKAIVVGISLGGSTIAVHETYDHVIKNKI